MKIRQINKLVVAIVALAFANAATAEVITFNSLVGSWVNVLPVSGVTVSGNGTGSPSLRWGADAGLGQSGYDFVAETTPFDQIIPPSPSPDFDLGSFTHINNPIGPPTLASATLRLDADISVDLVNIGIVSFFIDFIHTLVDNFFTGITNKTHITFQILKWITAAGYFFEDIRICCKRKEINVFKAANFQVIYVINIPDKN